MASGHMHVCIMHVAAIGHVQYTHNIQSFHVALWCCLMSRFTLRHSLMLVPTLSCSAGGGVGEEERAWYQMFAHV